MHPIMMEQLARGRAVEMLDRAARHRALVGLRPGRRPADRGPRLALAGTAWRLARALDPEGRAVPLAALPSPRPFAPGH